MPILCIYTAIFPKTGKFCPINIPTMGYIPTFSQVGKNKKFPVGSSSSVID
jgi:hypothetical protein